MKLKHFIIATLFILLTTSPVFSQDTIYKKMAVSWEPIYMVNNGIRLNFDVHIKNNHWIEASPLFYSAYKGNSNSRYETLLGGGIDISHRILLEKDYNTPYFAYGFTAQYYKLNYSDNVWITYNENDLEYMVYDDMDVDHSILKIGPYAVIGYQTLFSKMVIIDIYAGLGIRKSYHFSNTSIIGFENNFNSYYGDFGYTGVMIVAGLKIGILF